MRRLAVVSVGAVVTMALLLTFFAWIALQVPWEVPDRAELTGPTVVYDRNGDELTRFTAQVDRRIVGLDEVSPAAVNAILAAEDPRFYEHRGVDPLALLRAVVVNVRTGEVTQGGSTLTQQFVKNTYLTPEQTLTRKVREAVLSIALERQMTKDEILEAYLNQSYFGELAFGIEAAAQTYWGISASELSASQGALLAQTLPRPSDRNPREDPQGARDRRDRILGEMRALGMITDGELSFATSQPVEVLPRERPTSDVPVFVEYVRRQLVAAYGEETVLTGALQVRTTIDREVQAALEASVAEHLPADQAGMVEAAATAIDPQTGDILGFWPGRGYGAGSSIDLATQYRSLPGSTFKPLVYLAALGQGMVPTDTYPAPSSVVPQTCEPLADGTNPFKQPVSNAGGAGFGRLTLEDALANSVNTVFVQLGCDVGPEAVRETADRFGVRTPLEAAPLLSIGNPPLGPTTLDMASAFATIANDGVHCPARSITSVVDQAGNRLDPVPEIVIALGAEGTERRHPQEWIDARAEELRARDRGRCYAVEDADRVRATTQALQRVVAETTGRRADIGRPQAGKTGTANDETFAWFVGYTPDITIAVQVSDPLRDPARVAAGEVRQPMRDVAGFSRVQGGTIPALIWKGAAERILADVPPREFPEPGELVGVDGRTVGPARPKPQITITPTPTETEAPTPSEAPSSDPTSAPTADPSEIPSEGGGGGGDDDGRDCFLIFCG